MSGRDPVELTGSDRQAARERAFRMMAGTVGALFLAFAVLGVAFFWFDRSAESLNHTHEVRNGIDNVRLTLTQAESAQRGYMLTGDAIYLNHLESARRRADARVRELSEMTRDNPSQQARLAALRQLMTQRLAMIDHTVRLRRDSGNAVAAIRLIRRGDGAQVMEGLGRLVAQLDQEEARLQAERARSVAVLRVGAVSALVVFAVLLAVLFTRSIRDINLDREAEADAAARLRTLLADRTLLLDEVNHRVKNSLQQIASVVRLQARAVQHEGAREALDRTLDRIIAVGRVHEQLYRSGDQVGAFDGGAYAESLARDLVASLGRDDIELETRVERAMLDLRQAVPLALILNELVTNALKYGCPTDRPCRIRVGLEREGDDYRLSVADEGEGLCEGFSLRGNKGLGMRAVEALAKQLGGRFVVEQPKRGAAFAVVFPRS